MTSFEKFNIKKDESFERRMQDEYISPIWDELEKIESVFKNLDQSSELANFLKDIRFEYNTKSEAQMDESELHQNLENLRAVVEKLQDSELTENEKVSMAIEAIKSSY